MSAFWLRAPACGAVFIASTLAGCGGAPQPVDQIAATQAAIRGAEEVGAAQDPQAALHLKLAQEQFDKAKAMAERDDNEPAIRLLARSQADADVARAFAKKVSAINAADEADKQLQKLKGGGAK